MSEKKIFRDFLCEVRAQNDEEKGDFITGQPIVRRYVRCGRNVR